MDSDPRAPPPPEMKHVFKKYLKLKLPHDLDVDPGLMDLGKVGQDLKGQVAAEGSIESKQLLSTFQSFAGERCEVLESEDAVIYTHKALPGLLIIPALLPPEIQKLALQRLFHRDLSDSKHLTNLHLHYEIPYQDNPGKLSDGESTTSHASFFSLAPDSLVKFEPKDPYIHKPLSISQVMQRKLRWATLGGQYDWTNKVYPPEKPPAFPADLAALVEGLFPDMKAQAAIVNLYSPGDTLSLHRDVSEECEKGLVSISLGCDCIFLVGLERRPEDESNGNGSPESTCVAFRLRSGDAVFMSKDSRFAWHGVPKILAGTCPSYLEDWPAGSDGQYANWRGWMRNKRVNLNVRQMFD